MDLTHRLFKNKEENADYPTESELSNTAASFQQTNCLHLIKAMRQCEWKAPEFWSGLFETFMANMSHPYKTVREKIAFVR